MHRCEEWGPAGLCTRAGFCLLHINDCLNGLSCDAVMLADDVKIWRTIESPSEVQSPQNDYDLGVIVDATLKPHH